MSRAWANHGIAPNVPKRGQSIAKEWRKPITEQRQKERDLWQQYERAWMGEVREAKRFPDWSRLWTLEKIRVISNEKYKGKTTEERRAIHKRRKESLIVRLGMDGYLEYKKKQLADWKERREVDEPGFKRRIYKEQQEYLRNRYRELTGGHEAFEERKRTRERISERLIGVDALRKHFREIMLGVRHRPNDTDRMLVGCSTVHLRSHLESQFKSWMNWRNYGSRWHVDHIIPCAAFDQKDMKQRRQCWHWTNLRPLCAKRNIAKGATITDPQMSLMI